MANVSTHTTPQPGKFQVSQNMKVVFAVSMALGLIAFGVGLYREPERVWHAYLVGFLYFLCLALGGLFFAAVNHVAKAGWSVNVRRIAESFTSFFPIAGLALIGLLAGSKYLYIWLDKTRVASDALISAKASYLNAPFFIVRLIVFFGIWFLFSRKIVGNSIAQDASGDEKLTLKNLPLSVIYIILFALSFSLFCVDTVMSLEPHWFSTIFGVYIFAGMFQSTIAVMILITLYAMKNGWLRGLVNDNHLHDLGKFLKAFTVFYAYIAFSQFMLIWYANLPEETIFYLNRADGGWMAVSYSLLIFKFAVPFLLLLPKAAKRTPASLGLVSCLILVMQYVDLFWLVYPNFEKGHVVFGAYEIGLFLLFFGLFAWKVTDFLSKNNLVPIKDPRIQESIHHEVTY